MASQMERTCHARDEEFGPECGRESTRRDESGNTYCAAHDYLAAISGELTFPIDATPYEMERHRADVYELAQGLASQPTALGKAGEVSKGIYFSHPSGGPCWTRDRGYHQPTMPDHVRAQLLAPDDEAESAWDVCACDHYRAEHTGPSGHCETIIIHGGRERDCVCRVFRFKRRRRT